METKFTPGPWMVVPGNDYYIETEYEMTKPKYNTGLNVPTKTEAERSMFLAEISNGTNDFGEANAHLIAAAPDLYAALEDILLNDSIQDGERLKRGIYALAKARGEV